MKTIILSICLLSSLLINAQTQVTFYTTAGNFDLELEDSLAPVTSDNFLSLVDQKFYDGVIFHRVINNFIIQGGDPTGTGFGGPGYTITDEFHPLLDNVEMTISMANSGPNTGGSQFFFNMTNNTFLDFDKPPLSSQHPVFGKVVSGYSVLQSIETVAVNANDRPIVDVVMDSIRVINPALSIDNPTILPSSEITIYPNPSSDYINIDSQNPELSNLSVDIYDAQSKLVLSSNLQSKTQLAISHLTKGAYFVRVYNDNFQVHKTLIVQ